MSSALPAVPTAARSMLEEMLAAVKLRDEKPKDEPPALPARPTLKRRPPSTKNNVKFKIESDPADFSSKDIDSPEKVAYSGEDDKDSHQEDSQKFDTSQKLGHVEEQAMVLSLRLEELEKVVADMTEELRRKEDENVALLQKVQVYEKRYSVCEEKLHSVEDVYQKQIQSLKMDLDEAQKNLSTVNMAKQQMLDGTPTTSWPARDADEKSNNADNKSNNAVYQLTKEFEKQKQIFEDDVPGLSNVKSSGQTDSAKKSMEELRKLKTQYASWKKEYKVRLHEAKKALRKLAESEGKKPGRRWWCRRRRIIRNRIPLCSSA